MLSFDNDNIYSSPFIQSCRQTSTLIALSL